VNVDWAIHVPAPHVIVVTVTAMVKIRVGGTAAAGPPALKLTLWILGRTTEASLIASTQTGEQKQRNERT
jgi:hypothetical protein